MKKLLVLFISCLLVFSLGALPVSAANSGAHIFVDGLPLKSKSVSKNGESFVSYKEVFAKLKIGSKYDAKLKQVTGTKAGLKITFKLGNKTAYVNGKKKTLKAAPFAQKGTTYVPIRFVAEATGYTVYWSKEANLFQINSPKFNGASYSIDGVTVLFSKNGTVLIGPAALEELRMQKELAEIKAYNDFIASLPEFRFVGVPPTEEESKLPGYKGYPDYFDGNYGSAVRNEEKLPPLMSEGWISLAMLSEIEHIENLGSRVPKAVTIGKYIGADLVTYNIVLTDEYKKAKDGDFVLSDIHVKKYKGTMYLKIEDLKTVGLIEST